MKKSHIVLIAAAAFVAGVALSGKIRSTSVGAKIPTF